MQTKTTNHRNSFRPRRPAYWGKLAITLLIVTAVISGLWLWHNHRNTAAKSTAATASHSDGQINPNQLAQSDNAVTDQQKGNDDAQATTDQSTANTAPVSFSVSITRVSQVNDTVQVGTLVEGVSSGNCSLTASAAGQTDIDASATVRRDINSYDCGVFSLPLAKFGGGGNWKFDLQVTSNGKTQTDSWTQDINS